MADTIYALSSGQLPSAIAIVRVSGPKSKEIYERLIDRQTLEPRSATLSSVRTRNGDLIDQGLAVWFPGPASATGEDLLELHLHGGKAVVAKLFAELENFPGVRMARPGEFTERAFLNGRIDLASAEAIADLVDARTEAQRRLALQNISGRQASVYECWRSSLLEARALIEAELDFADEEDIPGSVSDQVWETVAGLKDAIDHQLTQAKSAEIVREGFRVAIVGAPNVGKSSLLNALAAREAAIVSPIAGTTRDLIELSIDVDGYELVLVDTAGLREAADDVERMGIDRAHAAASQANLILYLADRDQSTLFQPTREQQVLRLQSKSDLSLLKPPSKELRVSSVTGEGLEELKKLLRDCAKASTGAAEQVLPTRQRHREALGTAISHLTRSLDHMPLELRAEELRLASDALGAITGHSNVEELLGAIFSRFCIGK